ncbi:MAG: copper transporter [Chloroflexi bacterium]|nr:copper transporter [Chloroflexota bacterium]
MFDMRYHIVSLVAVFLALAVGIVLGSVIVDKGTLVEQQKSLVGKLEKDFADLRSENARLNGEVQRDEQYAKQSFYPLTKDRLAGQHIAVIFTSPVDNTTKRTVLDALHWSGATYSSVSINQSWNLDDKNVQDKVMADVQGSPGQTLRERLLNRLADFYLAPPADNKVLLDYAAAGLIGADALPAPQPNGQPAVQPNAVLLVGGSDGKNTVKEVDGVLIDRLKGAGKVRLVGVETSARKVSYMNAYQRSGIATVDNIDERSGQVSMIFALAGASGNFGTKPTANQPIPTMAP